MKKYHLFAGCDYYPNAFEDYVGSYGTKEEAEEMANNIISSGHLCYR